MSAAPALCREGPFRCCPAGCPVLGLSASLQGQRGKVGGSQRPWRGGLGRKADPEQRGRGTCRQTAQGVGASLDLAPQPTFLLRPLHHAGSPGPEVSLPSARTRDGGLTHSCGRAASLKESPSRLETLRERRRRPRSGDWGCVSIALSVCTHTAVHRYTHAFFPSGLSSGRGSENVLAGIPVQLHSGCVLSPPWLWPRRGAARVTWGCIPW